ncbi:MAG TPA: DMT family transporter [Novosphingobium sp.]
MLALGLRIMAAMVFATLLMLVKYAGESGVSLPEIMFWRQAVPIPTILGYLALTGGLHRLRTKRLGTHARRAGVGMTNMVLNFGAAILLPLAESTTLGFSTPLFAVLIAAVWMRETVGPWRWTAVVLGFVGVAIIAQPGGEPISPLGATMGLIAAFLIAVINYQIRDLGRTEEPISSSFWFAAFGAPLAGLALPFFMTAHSGAQWLVLIGIGLCGTIAQFLLAASLRHGAVASVIVMDYTALIWATLYGWAIWDRLPPAMTWLGAPLIIAAGVTIAWRQHVLSKAPPPASSIELD